MRLKPYLQLVRLPNLFTAAADSLAGWLLAGGALADLRHWPWLVLASVSIYAGGVVLNDVFDLEIDRRERPGRPIPSGRVEYRLAAILGTALLGIGVLSAWAATTKHGLAVALILVGCVLAYDAGLKSTTAGPGLMGACRGLNLLLGMSEAWHLGGLTGWLVTAAYGLFVMGITWISRSEVEPRAWGNPGVRLGVGLQVVAFGALVGVAYHQRAFTGTWQGDLARVVGVLVLVVVGALVSRRTTAAIWTARPEVVQRAVKASIFALVWIHVGLLLAVRGPVAALSVVWLWVPAVVVGRWVYST
jgi:UbiA prenyltransferase family